MIKIRKNLSGFLALTAMMVSSIALQAQQTSSDSTAFQKMLDSMGISKQDLEAKVQSTLLFGGSAPVSFSGEARLKLQFHQVNDPPLYLQEDKTYLQANWEGNESFVRLGMVVRAGRNTVLWSKIGFQHTLPGSFLNKMRSGDTIVDQRTYKDGVAATIHEDMNAGFALRTVPASFWLKLGAVHWIESSPLTVWKAQPRTFAWEYLPFEVEQPIARYYEYNIAKGEKSGRAAWNKKPFQGVNLESINLPGNLYFNFLWGTLERLDNNEREFLDFSNDLAYADQLFPVKGSGIGDSYRHHLFGRIAANELLGRLTPSLDFSYINFNNDIYTMDYFKKVFSFSDTTPARGFYKEPVTFSADIRGPLNDKFKMHANVAINFLDTTWVKQDTQHIDVNGTRKTETHITSEKIRTAIHPALYIRLENKYFIPVSADIAVISKGFYSPLSFAPPVDAFYPFGANLSGPGKFIGRGEASPYVQNMAGINLQVVPKVPGYGHFKFTYGQHFQLESAQDVIFFPYRLNGQDLFSLFHSSYNRWGSYPVDLAIPEFAIGSSKGMTGKKKYFNRAGDEGFVYPAEQMPRGPMSGGLRTDYLSSFEGFVPYPDSASVDSNVSLQMSSDYNINYITKTGQNVPKHKKFTFNLELDGSYDVGPLIGYPRDLFVGLYVAVNGVSSAFKALSFNEKDKDMMLWGTYFRFEPAIAITNKFYIVGLAGLENWLAKDGYIVVTKDVDRVDAAYIEKYFGTNARDIYNSTGKFIKKVPIYYRDYAVGIGFDWDMLSRVGLHGRVKWMQHEDVNFKANSWQTPIVTAEIKTWF